MSGIPSPGTDAINGGRYRLGVDYTKIWWTSLSLINCVGYDEKRSGTGRQRMVNYKSLIILC